MENYLGESIPKLGFGLMRLPQENGIIDIEQTKKMVDLFLEKGFRYFDTAWGYPGSEDAIKAALTSRHARDEYLFATKLPAWAAGNKEAAEKMFETSLERTGAGYFDFYLLHNLGENRTHYFDDYDLWSFALEKKKQGLVKHLGFSFHDRADALDKILTAHPEMEFVQLQINYADWDNPSIESRKCYETARKHGKPVIIMEPVKGGRLAEPPRQAVELLNQLDENASAVSWALRFAASLDGVIAVLSGMSSEAQMEENLALMKNFQPLTEEEKTAVENVGRVILSIPTIPCTSCGYCIKDCPQSVAIYGAFQSQNMYLQYGNLDAAKGNYTWNTEGHGWAKASECVQCGACEEVCPQHIAIREELAKVAKTLE